MSSSGFIGLRSAANPPCRAPARRLRRSARARATSVAAAIAEDSAGAGLRWSRRRASRRAQAGPRGARPSGGPPASRPRRRRSARPRERQCACRTPRFYRWHRGASGTWRGILRADGASALRQGIDVRPEERRARSAALAGPGARRWSPAADARLTGWCRHLACLYGLSSAADAVLAVVGAVADRIDRGGAADVLAVVGRSGSRAGGGAAGAAALILRGAGPASSSAGVTAFWVRSSAEPRREPGPRLAAPAAWHAGRWRWWLSRAGGARSRWPAAPCCSGLPACSPPPPRPAALRGRASRPAPGGAAPPGAHAGLGGGRRAGRRCTSRCWSGSPACSRPPYYRSAPPPPVPPRQSALASFLGGCGQTISSTLVALAVAPRLLGRPAWPALFSRRSGRGWRRLLAAGALAIVAPPASGARPRRRGQAPAGGAQNLLGRGSVAGSPASSRGRQALRGRLGGLAAAAGGRPPRPRESPSPAAALRRPGAPLRQLRAEPWCVAASAI